MLTLASIKPLGNRVFCQVKNMFMGDKDSGFTLFEGPIETAIDNIRTGLFRVSRESMAAAFEAFRAIDQVNAKLEAKNVVAPASQFKPILAAEIILLKGLPAGVSQVFYKDPFTQSGGQCNLKSVTSKPRIGKDFVRVEIGNMVVNLKPNEVLYYI